MRKVIAGILSFIVAACFVGNLFGASTEVKSVVKKPVIGISASLSRKFMHTTIRSYVNEYYANAVIAAGGVPVILPVTDNKEAIFGMIDVIDGLILSGGADVNPLLYGEEPHPSLEALMPRRDSFETNLLKLATNKKLPVFGICRGQQFINVYNGGTLYQDIHDMTNSNVRHRQLTDREVGTHTVDVKKGTWLHGILGDKAVVNTYHHQAVKDLAPGFVVAARSKDGSIEAIEKIKGSFCMGVQWHPERMQKGNELMLKLFKEFINVCRKNTRPVSEK